MSLILTRNPDETFTLTSDHDEHLVSLGVASAGTLRITRAELLELEQFFQPTFDADSGQPFETDLDWFLTGLGKSQTHLMLSDIAILSEESEQSQSETNPVVLEPVWPEVLSDDGTVQQELFADLVGDEDFKTEPSVPSDSNTEPSVITQEDLEEMTVLELRELASALYDYVPASGTLKAQIISGILSEQEKYHSEISNLTASEEAGFEAADNRDGK